MSGAMEEAMHMAELGLNRMPDTIHKSKNDRI